MNGFGAFFFQLHKAKGQCVCFGGEEGNSKIL